MITPKHKKVQFFLEQNLFVDIKNFAELENRISNLSERYRGDAFEVFAEAYFATQRIHSAKDILPESEISQKVRETLGLPSTDKGIDGIFKVDDQYHAYQVKYRKNRSTLSWDELSTFMALSDKVYKRVLFTNANELSSIMDDRSNFYSIRGNDLDKLDESDFQAIEEWLKTGLITPRIKKTPRDYQQEALSNIVQELKLNDRTTVVMACGTGKTLIALWVAEKRKDQTILVLLPSLALVKQILHEWAKESIWEKFSYLCVCSDKTVNKNKDGIVLQQHEIDFSVTTQKEDIEKYFKKNSISHKIIFSTYQSAQIVAQAMPQGFSFDLAVFDEAHKTASRQEAYCAFAVQDKNLPIKKRLFLTATPRHYNISKKDKEDNQRLVFSMDDEKIYGKIAYELSFREAIKKCEICDYKIIISIVTSEMISREQLRRGEVIVEGDIIKAQRIANILALQHVVDEYGIRRIFSFHNSVSAAESFTANTNEGIGAHLKNFTTLHVNGKMPTSKRDAHLKEFKQADKAIISNARCLTEGVDVPVVDMVAFISPKKSEIDIVQAVGRAMRKAEGKNFGYILIPLFVQTVENETIGQAAEKTNFETVFDVLQAMQEQDESLVEIIDQMREDRGRVLGFNDSILREKVEILGPKLYLAELRKVITTKIIDVLGSDWNFYFGKLVYFKEQNHNKWPSSKSNNSEERTLGMWCGIQRKAIKKNRLSLEQINRLNVINFPWHPIDEIWFFMFDALCEFRKINTGKWPSTISDCDNEKKLARWCGTQRKAFRQNKLSIERIGALESIEFVWNEFDNAWNKAFEQLKDFRQKNPTIWPSQKSNCLYEKKLGRWSTIQRADFRKGELEEEKIDALNSIAFQWEPIEAEWYDKFYALEEFLKNNKRWPSGKSFDPYERSLGQWCGTQRQAFKSNRKNGLTSEKILLLQGIGFPFNVFEDAWERNWQHIVHFIELFARLPKRDEEFPQGNKLGGWLREQYKKNKKNTLSMEKKEKLGFFEEL